MGEHFLYSAWKHSEPRHTFVNIKLSQKFLQHHVNQKGSDVNNQGTSILKLFGSEMLVKNCS